MSDNLPPSRPTTTRIGGGGSAHVAAIGVVVVLLALVWVGWSGRPAGPDASASLPPVAEASATVMATGRPAATLGPPPAASGLRRPTGSHTLAEGPDRPRIHLAEDVYGFTATIDGRQYFAVLQETGSDRFTATVRLPFLQPRDAPSVELHQLWTRAERSNYAELGSWPLPLEAIDPNVRRSGTVLKVEVPAERQARGQALLVRRGFTLDVAVDSQLLFAILEVDVRLLPRIVHPLGEDGRLDPAVDAGRLFVDRDRSVR
jgi:hypothetical protein